MSALDRPWAINWDVTYACPLRCTHCYSESGRRASRQLSLEDMLRVADAFISLRPRTIQLSGGEPLLVKGIFQVAERISQAGIPVTLYTSGWLLDERMVADVLRVFSRVHVSVDGATAKVHDTVRAKPGSFERAMKALGLLDEAVREQRERGEKGLTFGIDGVVVRSNFHQLEEFCTTLAPRFPQARFLSLGAAVPSGLANRPGFADHELLTDDQLWLLGSPGFTRYLQSLAPSSVRVDTTDGLFLQMHPDHIASGKALRGLMHVEPDGAVRSMPIYEGTVGNLLSEPAQVLWERALARHLDPYLAETLGPVRTMKEWAKAARRIDLHYGSDQTRARIYLRQNYRPRPSEPGVLGMVRREPPPGWGPGPTHAPAH
jgi:MoaA/NifB/PqqE/SkfB family radical SAM enzyme